MSERQQPSENASSAATTPKQKVCEKCGVKFDCFSSAGPCWCEEVKLKPESLANLRKQYNDCLCPNCLKATADQKTA
jgi:hypothetical protein